MTLYVLGMCFSMELSYNTEANHFCSASKHGILYVAKPFSKDSFWLWKVLLFVERCTFWKCQKIKYLPACLGGHNHVTNPSQTLALARWWQPGTISHQPSASQKQILEWVIMLHEIQHYFRPNSPIHWSSPQLRSESLMIGWQVHIWHIYRSMVIQRNWMPVDICIGALKYNVHMMTDVWGLNSSPAVGHLAVPPTVPCI